MGGGCGEEERSRRRDEGDADGRDGRDGLDVDVLAMWSYSLKRTSKQVNTEEQR